MDEHQDVQVVRDTLNQLEFDFAHGADPFELELVRWPTEAGRDSALAAFERIIYRAKNEAWKLRAEAAMLREDLAEERERGDRWRERANAIYREGED